MVGDWKNINVKKEKREKNKKVVVLEKTLLRNLPCMIGFMFKKKKK